MHCPLPTAFPRPVPRRSFSRVGGSASHYSPCSKYRLPSNVLARITSGFAAEEGTEERAEFERGFKESVAAAVAAGGLAPEVTITGISPGSVVVDFDVTVPLSAGTQPRRNQRD